MKTRHVFDSFFRAFFSALREDSKLDKIQLTLENMMTTEAQEAAALKAAFESLKTAVTNKLSELQSKLAGAVSVNADDLGADGRQAFDSVIADINTFTQTVGGTSAPGTVPPGNTPGGPGTGTDVATPVATQTGGTSTSTMDGAPSTGSSATDDAGSKGTDVTKDPSAPVGTEVQL